MKRLSKAQAATIAALRERWATSTAAYLKAVEEADDAIAVAVATVNAAIADLNEIVEEGNTIREEIETEALAYADERSDAWRDGERGSEYATWCDAWGVEIEEIENVSIDEIEIADLPDEILPGDDYPEAPSE